MKQGMSNVDVAALAAELRPLLCGSRLEKAYQPEKDQVLLRLRRKGVGRLDVLFALGRFLTVTKRPPENPDKPSMVAQILRSTLGNGRVVGFRQVGFDRLLRMDVERGDGKWSLVFELFGDGNMLLLDSEDTIVLPMRGGDYGARRLRKGEAYLPPPGGSDPLALDLAGLEAAGQAARKDLVRMLAVELGFGPQWAEELCLRAGLPKNAEPAGLEAAQWHALHAELARLGGEIARNDLAPVVVFEAGKPVDAVPFVLRLHEQKGLAMEEAATFREALDRFYIGAEEDEDETDPRRRRFEEAAGKLRRQEAQVATAISRFEELESEARQRGDALYASFQTAQQILDTLNEARQSRSWVEIEETLRAGRGQGNAMAMRVPELRPDTATAVLVLQDTEGGDVPVDVDLRLNVQDNADRQYALGKKARKRREGALTALEDARSRLRELEAKGLDAFGAAPSRAPQEKRHFWFEPYRWTVTPSGLVAVGGRNAGQNDQVVKKYLRDGDRYVHAQIHGAPSVVLRGVDRIQEAGEDDLRVACQFAACASRAWRQFGAGSAYWVTPQQVNKTPRSGEFVSKGAWIVHGKRNIVDGLPMQWAVGLVRFKSNGQPVPPDEDAGEAKRIEKLVGGPPDGIRPWATAMWHLAPGEIDPNDAAMRLAAMAGVTVEEAQAALPPGPVGEPAPAAGTPARAKAAAAGAGEAA